MLSMPSYYFSDFYDAKTDSLSPEAPDSMKNEYEEYHSYHKGDKDKIF